MRVLPIDLGQVFPVSGGLPLGQRAPQRQAYRLVELARFRDALGLPLNLKPKFFPVSGDPAARLIVAVDRAIDAGVFGSPSYVIEGEIFWGQDRLDFVERRLARQG